MVRAPCCEKMGLKKGPWTLEEDQILVAHIQKYGHENWRALPKQAGLLRCGKSCRLRWTNYLRPDIKRGNFSREEEETIIKLHELLGNRWSAIAARLPGRTDNEIKNVWHTHLKKKLRPNELKRKTRCNPAIGKGSNSMIMKPDGIVDQQRFKASPSRSYSDVSSMGNDSTTNADFIKEEYNESLEGFQEIDESFWSEALSLDNCRTSTLGGSLSASSDDPFSALGSSHSDSSDMSFWLRVFMEVGEQKELPGI